jgi:hypothetical protein
MMKTLSHVIFGLWVTFFCLLLQVTAEARPQSISNLTALAVGVEGNVTLQWTSPDPADSLSTPAGYLLKYATSVINASDFYSTYVSTYVQNWTGLAACGNSESRTLTGLTPGVTMYFALVAIDKDSNYGLWLSSSDTSGQTNTVSQ